jgi:hypothetical protein
MFDFGGGGNFSANLDSHQERARQQEHNYAACRRVISAKAACPSPVNEYGAPRS